VPNVSLDELDINDVQQVLSLQDQTRHNLSDFRSEITHISADREGLDNGVDGRTHVPPGLEGGYDVRAEQDLPFMKESSNSMPLVLQHSLYSDQRGLIPWI